MKTLEYGIFWQKIHQSAKQKSFPLRVMFELTYRCNFRCKHCYVPFGYRKTKELSTKKVYAIIDQLAKSGCFYLGFTGGEPFMRKDALDIFWHAKKKGFELIIYSNGSLINKNIAKELAQIRPNKVDITIPAMSERAFDKITGLNGSRERVFKTIELLRKNGVALGFKTCVLRENEKEINGIREFARSLGALHRLDDMLSRRLDGSDEPYKFRGELGSKRVSGIRYQVSGKAQADDCALLFDNRKPQTLPAGRQGTNLEPKIQNLFKCGVGKTQAAITPSGELKMCLMINHFRHNILDSSFKGCWNRLKRDVSKIKPDNNYQCHKCKLQIFCKWCPARSWLYNRSFTSCELESRKKAELIRRSLHLGGG